MLLEFQKVDLNDFLNISLAEELKILKHEYNMNDKQFFSYDLE